MLSKDSSTTKFLLNMKKVAFSKRNHYKGKKSAKRVIKAPIIKKPVMQYKPTLTNIIGRGSENLSNNYTQYQFK
jgi:hypothetical protein|tara:strand:- start:359 stop:580 length:222 start_codon:yes stop_codon:yes gene_type:complete